MNKSSLASSWKRIELSSYLYAIALHEERINNEVPSRYSRGFTFIFGAVIRCRSNSTAIRAISSTAMSTVVIGGSQICSHSVSLKAATEIISGIASLRAVSTC